MATADDIKSLDPALAFDTWSTAVVHAMTRRLVDYDADGKLIGDLAEKWDVSPDGKKYTFHLRGDVKFANGTAIEAKHFQTALKRVQDPKTASPGSGFYSAIERIDASEPKTLVMILKQPEPTLLNALGMTFAAPIQEGNDPAKAAGSGPYTLESYEPGARVVLARNPEYSGQASNLERMVVQLKVDEALQWTRIQSGEVDLLGALPAAQMARVLSNPAERSRYVTGVVNQTWYFGMNLRKKPFDNPKVRQAALLALDRQRHVQLAGTGQLANGILPPHVPGYDPARKLPERNVEEAKRLLAEAGFPNGLTGTKPVMWLNNTDQYQRHAEAIQSDLVAVGIAVELRPATFSEYLTGYRTNADCWYGGWYPDFPDAGNFLEPVLHGKSIREGRSPNAARYDNPRVNALLDQAHTTPLGDARRALYKQTEDLILADLPWIPLYYEAETRYFREGVTGVTVHPVWRQMLTGIGLR